MFIIVIIACFVAQVRASEDFILRYINVLIIIIIIIIEDWMIAFPAYTAAETPNAVQWAGQPPSEWSIWRLDRFSRLAGEPWPAGP